MNNQTPKIYAPISAKKIVFQDGGSIMKLGVNAEKMMEFLKSNTNAKGYCNLVMTERICPLVERAATRKAERILTLCPTNSLTIRSSVRVIIKKLSRVICVNGSAKKRTPSPSIPAERAANPARVQPTNRTNAQKSTGQQNAHSAESNSTMPKYWLRL